MRFGLLQIALGAALLGVAYLVGGLGWSLAWPASAVALVGLGYVGLGPRVFGKRPRDGKLSWWGRVLLLPYLTVAWALWQLRGRLLGERAHDEVAPGVFLGRRPLSAAEVPSGVRVVVDLTSEFDRAAPTTSVERYFSLPTLDTSAPPHEELVTLMEVLCREEGPIFLHCAMGHGRSATVAAALLVERGLAADVDEAIAMLSAKRPGVSLHPPQRAAVERLLRRAANLREHDPTEDRPGRAPDPA